MLKIREIIRFSEIHGYSVRKISQALSVSRPVISEYIKTIKSKGLTFEDIKDMSDEDLFSVFKEDPVSDNERYKILSSNFKAYAKELTKPGVNRHLLWEEYKADNPDGYSYSQFCFHFQKWLDLSEISMHIDHKAGDKMFVDFTGKKLEITDRFTREKIPVEIFVAILGASQLTYVEASLNQKKENWISLNQNALMYFGGAPRAIVPDCLKSAVTKCDRYEPDINQEYSDFSRHFETTILPARSSKPKDKALVEGAVKIVYTRIFAKLRDRIFYSLEELNAEIFELLKLHNKKPMQRTGLSRLEVFESTEKHTLKALPIERYTIRKHCRLTVSKNYHVYLKDDKHYYSVPYRLRGCKVDLFYTDGVLEVFSGNIRVCSHKRSSVVGGYTTSKEHLHESHKWQDNYDSEVMVNNANMIGEDVANVIKHILDLNQHPEKSYKSCEGILRLSKTYSSARINEACKRAHYYQNYSYKLISNILKNNFDLLELDINNPELSIPDHPNIRGSIYFDNISEVLQ